MTGPAAPSADHPAGPSADRPEDGAAPFRPAPPAVPHLPGRNARPEEAGFAPLKAGLAEGMAAEAALASPAFATGLAAHRAGYHWEAHELWEAVWAALPPAAPERFLLRGLIQLANTRLKAAMRRGGAARRCLALADLALHEAELRGALHPPGLDREALGELRAAAASDSTTEFAL